MPAREQWLTERAPIATLAGLSGFIGFWAGAMALYPGGTFQNPKQPGQSFFGNFFCDLTQPVSLSGVANPVGSKLAQCGMLFFAVALWTAFWVVPRLLPRESAVRPWLRGFASLSVLTFVAVSLTPSEVFGRLHAVLALVAGGFGIVALLLSVRGLARLTGAPRVLALLGALALAVGAFDAVIFVRHLRDSAPPPLVVPAAQKVAAILLSLWMAGVAWLAILDNARRRA